MVAGFVGQNAGMIEGFGVEIRRSVRRRREAVGREEDVEKSAFVLRVLDRLERDVVDPRYEHQDVVAGGLLGLVEQGVDLASEYRDVEDLDLLCAPGGESIALVWTLLRPLHKMRNAVASITSRRSGRMAGLRMWWDARKSSSHRC